MPAAASIAAPQVALLGVLAEHTVALLQFTDVPTAPAASAVLAC